MQDDIKGDLKELLIITGVSIIVTAVVGGVLYGLLYGASYATGSMGTFAPGSIKCFADGELIYEGRSEGTIWESAAAIRWVDEATGENMSSSAECLITHD